VPNGSVASDVPVAGDGYSTHLARRISYPPQAGQEWCWRSNDSSHARQMYGHPVCSPRWETLRALSKTPIDDHTHTWSHTTKNSDDSSCEFIRRSLAVLIFGRLGGERSAYGVEPESTAVVSTGPASHSYSNTVTLFYLSDRDTAGEKRRDVSPGVRRVHAQKYMSRYSLEATVIGCYPNQ